ncbi:MAG: NYN domain-containing protein [Candidatus Pacebacteria bacterium]|nr:NYN domain-containing protein [Candidatus Paceibacterota bacterium]
MNQAEIKTFIDGYQNRRERTIVIVDFSNVEKWKKSLGWKIGIQELSRLVRNFSIGQQYLRRFYYGSDYGPKERSVTLTAWSAEILHRASMNRFEVVTKRVKYIHDKNGSYEKKCDLDVEMTVDLIRERDNYDQAVIFSGDGDLVYAMRYLHDNFGKNFIVFGARGHTGSEVQDAPNEGIVSRILYADDFEYRLNMDRFRRR